MMNNYIATRRSYGLLWWTWILLLLSFLIVHVIAQWMRSFERNFGLATYVRAVAGTAHFEQVIDHLQHTEVPRDQLTNLLLGDAYWQIGDQKRANEIWQAGVSDSEFIRMVTFWIERGDLFNAKEWLAKAKEGLICQTDYWVLQAMIFEAAKQWSESNNSYQTALRHTSSSCQSFNTSDVWYRIGQMWRHKADQSDTQTALEAYEMALKIDDFSDPVLRIDTYYQAGQLRYTLGPEHDPLAIHNLAAALELNADHRWANLFMGLALYRHTRNFTDSVSYIERAYQVDQGINWQFPFYLGELYRQQGDRQQAIYYYHATLEISPGHNLSISRLKSLNASTE